MEGSKKVIVTSGGLRIIVGQVLLANIFQPGVALSQESEILSMQPSTIKRMLLQGIYNSDGQNIIEDNIIRALKCIYDYTSKCAPLKKLTSRVFKICLDNIHIEECKKPLKKMDDMGVIETLCQKPGYMTMQMCIPIYTNLMNGLIQVRTINMKNVVKAKELSMSIKNAEVEWKGYEESVQKLKNQEAKKMANQK